MDPELTRLAVHLLALLIAIPVHEFAHALSAVKCGDDGPRREGRLTIYPWDHFDALGAIFCVISAYTGFGLGWGKPVMVDPGRLRNPRWHMCLIAACGPFANLLLALAFSVPFHARVVTDPTSGMGQVLFTFILVNLSLMLFNLIPLGPLDGAKVVSAFLSYRQAGDFWAFQQRWGSLILMALILLPPGRIVFGFLVGLPLVTILQWLLPGIR